MIQVVFSYFNIIIFGIVDITRQSDGGQTGKCLVTKPCLIVFGRQTFPV